MTDQEIYRKLYLLFFFGVNMKDLDIEKELFSADNGVKINIVMPNDGTWIEWADYCGHIDTQMRYHGKQASFYLWSVLQKVMQSDENWQAIKKRKGLDYAQQLPTKTTK